MSFLTPPEQLTPPAALSTAGELVSERFATASEYASTLWALAQTLLGQLGTVELNADWTAAVIPTVDSGGLSGITAAAPTPPDINDITVSTVDFPYAAPDPVIDDLPARTSPDQNITDPGFAIPSPPNVVWPVFTAVEPGVSDAIIPEAPTTTLPSVPQLSNIIIPSPPEYNIPEFAWELPTEDLTAPNPQFVWNEAEYDSAIKQMLATKLYDNLVNGGSGLPPTTEQAIYDRATSRMTDEEQIALDQMLDFFSGRGFDLPPGALAGQMLELNNKILKTREDLNNDILVQQSKLAQENTQFIITASINNEKVLMDNVNQFQNRAFEAAKATVILAVQVYQARIEAYKARLAAYETQAEIFKARVEGEIAKAEFYKAQIQGVLASTEVQKALVDIYKAQIMAVTTTIEMYKAQMEGAQIRAQIDEVRIRGFAALVQAYSAQVAAASERYKGYQAQIAGEVAKAEMYKAQVEAYTARVGAYRTEVEADTLVLKQRIAINENQTEIFKAHIQQYLAQVQAAVQQAEIRSKNEGLKIDTFKAQTAEYSAELEALTKVFLGRVEEVKAKAEIEVKEADLAIKEVIAQQELIQGNIRAAAQVASQMAAAAIAGVSASANIQHGEHRSDSTSMSVAEQASSVSTSNTSVINQHITQS